MAVPGLGVGRTVHFVLPSGIHRPAMVSHVDDGERGAATLHVYVDPLADRSYLAGSHDAGLLVIEREIPYSYEPHRRTWHWPERG